MEKFRVRRWSWQARLAIAVLLSLDAQIFAQDSTARITGVVRSTGGSGLAQAVLTLHNAASGGAVTVRTDSQGRYEVRGLIHGNYSVTVTHSGFLTEIHADVLLLAGQSAEENFALELEKPGPSASATPKAQSVSPSPARAGEVIDQSQLIGLPMNGRSVSQLATLEAGVSDSSGGGKQSSGGSSLTMSGGRSEWNGFLMDGTDINGTDNTVPQSAAGGQLGAQSSVPARAFQRGQSPELQATVTPKYRRV